MSADTPEIDRYQPRFLRLHLTNFLSHRHSILEFGDLVALVGPNASGKSNTVAAVKLLREIPIHGLPTALARRGGFDQLRHRSAGHPYDPAIRIDFIFEGASEESHYELKLKAISGKRYEVKRESAYINVLDQDNSPLVTEFTSASGVFNFEERIGGHIYSSRDADRAFPIPPGQSAINSGGSYASYLAGQALQSMQTVEINPSSVAELQDPSSTKEYESDGSNSASLLETLSPTARAELADEVASIVPGITDIESRRYADKLTTMFTQETNGRNRQFLAKQMSDGTLRVFGILLAMKQFPKPRLLVIEEPEVAIHLGALRTLVSLLEQETRNSQIVLTTHSADILDAVYIGDVRVVWNDGGSSSISRVADYTIETVRSGLITPGELLRAGSLDPESA